MTKKTATSIYIISTIISLFNISCGYYGDTDTRTAIAQISPSEYEINGVNMEHLFIFSDSTMSYNGKPFMLGQTIEELSSIFGTYNRKTKDGIYLWDSIGVSMVSDFGKIHSIDIYWDVDMSQITWKTDNKHALKHQKKAKEAVPKKFFKGDIVVGNTVFGLGTNLYEFLLTSSIDFENSYELHRHDNDIANFSEHKSKYWNHTNSNLFRKEQVRYVIFSQDHNKKENLRHEYTTVDRFKIDTYWNNNILL